MSIGISQPLKQGIQLDLMDFPEVFGAENASLWPHLQIISSSKDFVQLSVFGMCVNRWTSKTDG